MNRFRTLFPIALLAKESGQWQCEDCNKCAANGSSSSDVAIIRTKEEKCSATVLAKKDLSMDIMYQEEIG